MLLDEIVAHKHEEVAAKRQEVPLEALHERIQHVSPPRDLRTALRQEGISLIAEFKRRSPSKGEIMMGAEVRDVVTTYEQSGARALSILTDEKYFGGSLADLTRARESVRIPCLRKEFIIDPYQIYESRAAGADAILLIVRILSEAQLRDFLAVARSLAMQVLVETHTAAEIEQAVAAGAHIIGINNRDLDTLTMDVQTTMTLKRGVPGGHVLVSESGIHTRDHVKMLEGGGVDAILVGESLLTSRDLRGKVRELLGRDEV